MTYAEQIKHPKWQKKRLEVMEASNFECQNCGTKEDTLHVHHPIYRKGAMIWEYKNEELECLCQDCHKYAHEVDEELKKVLAYHSFKETIIGFARTLTAKFDAYDGPVQIRLDSYEECTGAIAAIAIDKWEERDYIRKQLELIIADGDGKSVLLERTGVGYKTLKFTASK